MNPSAAGSVFTIEQRTSTKKNSYTQAYKEKMRYKRGRGATHSREEGKKRGKDGSSMCKGPRLRRMPPQEGLS